MSKCKLCAFGVKVKQKLVEIGETQQWLEEEIKKDTGMYVDNGYLYKIFTGQRTAPKIVASINRILQLDDSTETDR